METAAHPRFLFRLRTFGMMFVTLTPSASLWTGVVKTFRYANETNSMQTVRGDLLALAVAGDFDVIIHGCNCQNTMGAGIAKSIKQQFAAAYDADLATEKGSRDKLGTYSSATVDSDGRELTVVNAYTQFNWRGRGIKADYDAIRSVFAKIKTNFAGKRIGYPLIGAGLAGGDWDVISQIITEELDGENHTLVEYQP